MRQPNDHSREGALTPFFEPAAIAVVGANRERHRIGSEILHNLVGSGFTGTIVPVHPVAETIQGLTAYPRLSSVPCRIDLAVIAVPVAEVGSAVEDGLAAGVRAFCVITATFAECGADGVLAEQLLVQRIREAGARLIGPNCLGLLNTDPRFSLNATFSPVYPPPGTVAMSTQSGALGLAILDYAKQLNIGLSSFVSVGNKADVSSNDLLEYWERDPRTAVILLYLESFGNPVKFSALARRISRTKPIVALKAGRSTPGARAAASHTGALASSDAFVDALFHQSGVIRTDTVTELFDVAALLARQPLPRGRRVAILTNAGGPGILAADACHAHGLEVTELAPVTIAALRALLPRTASAHNPVDILASAPTEHYRAALEVLLADERVDSVLVIFIPPLVTDADEVAAAVAHVAATQARAKPVVGVFMRSQAAPAALTHIPCYAFPEPAAIALSLVAAYSEWRQAPVGRVPLLANVQPTRARRIVASAAGRGGGWLTPVEAMALMAAVGIQTPRARLTTSVAGAVEAAERVGFPVAVKAVGTALLHKTEHRAIRLNLSNGAAVKAAAQELTAALGPHMDGLLVQAMVSGGAEMMVGAIHDRVFGHVVVCGSGGVLVDLLADSSCRLVPVTEEDARDMVNGLKGVRLLRGFRGAAPADERAFCDAILRVSALVHICPEIQEMDLNPLNVLPGGVSALDVRVRVAAPASAARGVGDPDGSTRPRVGEPEPPAGRPR